MNFDLSDEQKMLAEQARGLLAERVPFDRLRTLQGLEAAHGVLQAQVGRELRLRRTPVLRFQYDPTVEQGVRLGKMIDELAPDPPG